jgi:hypothetical protein
VSEKYKYEIKRKIEMPNGGSITVTVSQPDPINEADYLILKPQAAIEMANCLMDLAKAFKP